MLIKFASFAPSLLLAMAGGAVLAAPPAGTEQAPAAAVPPAMTLGQAQAYALAHQPAVEAARARLAAARSRAEVPRAGWLPQLALTAQAIEGSTNNTTASVLGAPGVDLPRIGGTRAVSIGSWSPSTSTLAGLGLRQEIYDFGRLAALSAEQDALEDSAQARTEAAALDVGLSVEEAFLAVVASKEVLLAARSSEDRAARHREEIRAAVHSGLRPPIELTRVEAELASAEVGRVRAEGGVWAAQSSFAAATGVPAPRLDAKGDPRPTTLPQGDLTAQALQRNPAVRIARDAEEAQRARTEFLSASLRPDVRFTSSISARAGGAAPSSGAIPAGEGILPEVANWDVGLVLSWPIFDGAQRALVSASRAEELQRTAESSELRAALTAAVQQATVEVQAAQAAVPALQRAVDAAQANAAQASARYRAGLASSLDLADADSLQVESEIQLALGRFSLSRAQARLAHALAVP